MKIAVIDYGLGNLHSVLKALNKVSEKERIFLATKKEQITSADKIILPGQGAILACMKALEKMNLIEVLKNSAKTKPFLGICIGPQLMSQRSEENGGVSALGLIPYHTLKFSSEDNIKIPHMGWNNIQQQQAHFLWQGIADNSFFYFVHSYFLQALENDNNTLGITEYGKNFCSAIIYDNLAGLQAHPEKSGDNGLKFLENFLKWKI